MKLSHRRVKKALKKSNPLPWERVMIKRGERRLKRRRDAALRAVQAGLIIAMGATQNAMAMASVGATKLEKAIRMANICLEVGEGLRKIYAEENEIKA